MYLCFHQGLLGSCERLLKNVLSLRSHVANGDVTQMHGFCPNLVILSRGLSTHLTPAINHVQIRVTGDEASGRSLFYPCRSGQRASNYTDFACKLLQQPDIDACSALARNCVCQAENYEIMHALGQLDGGFVLGSCRLFAVDRADTCERSVR